MCFNGTFGDLCVILSGYSFKPSSYVVSGKYDLITIKNLNGTFVDNKKTNKIDLIPSSLKKYCILEEGDILVSLTGNVGRVSINSSQHALLNQRVSKVICKNNDYKYFLYLMLNTQYYQEKMRQISNGTSQKNLSPLDIEKIKIYIPSNIEDFNNATKGLLKHMCQINISTIKLIALKEKLLPLLINRQLV